jgi:hypothetical protein
MVPLLVLTVLVAFFIGTAASFRTRRFLPGVLTPIACLAIYMMLYAGHQGGRLEGFLAVLPWAILVMAAMSVPVGLASAAGAFFGVSLAKRMGSVKDPASGGAPPAVAPLEKRD